jgi:Dyp-type peroxidase family
MPIPNRHERVPPQLARPSAEWRRSRGRSDEEPVLEADDIQGNILVGFNTAHQLLLFLAIEIVTPFKKWLRSFRTEITSLRSMLNARNGKIDGTVVWVNVAFSFQALKRLTTDAREFRDLPFKEGLQERSYLLGDPVEADAEGNCENWAIGGPHNVADVFLVVAGNDKASVAARAIQIETGLPNGLRLIFKDCGARLHGAHGAHEHFGFRDPVSQPGVRGRLSADPDDFLTPRQNPANPHQGAPGQNLIWPGEFVFGYPGQDPVDPWKPGAVARAGPSWGKNGSLLVFRRLRQDVAAFRSYLNSATEMCSKIPALRHMTAEKLAAKFVGRWPSGAPIMVAPNVDDPELAQDATAANNFTYLKLTPRQASSDIRGLRADISTDPHGMICPLASHIRKAYPRDHPTSNDTVASMETHRLLRRGIPFGEPYPAIGERGLLFLAYQTSIERQFEFVTRAWLNNPYLREGGDGHDPVAGQRSYAVNGNRTRNFALTFQNASGLMERLTLDLPIQWVTPTGGGYFFAPSIKALGHIVQ